MSLLNDQPTNFRILFLDMDAFFASCEQQLQPHLQGTPVGVTPVLGSSCIISPSYEAKRFGVTTGMPNREAKRLCPNLSVIEARPRLYKQLHYKILECLATISPWVTVKSVDEMAIHLSPSEQNQQTCHALAATIQTDLARTIGPYITASIGFGPNQFLAKVASDMNKPNGVSTITLENLVEQLGHVELTDLPGIALGSARRLHREGIYSTRQLLEANRHQLRHIFGFPGLGWWYRLHGYEVDEIDHRRSVISHSHVLEPAWRTPDKAYQVLSRLVHKVGQRLRRERFWAEYSSLGIRYVDGRGEHAYERTQAYCDSLGMINIADRLFTSRSSPGSSILKLSFAVSSLQRSEGIPLPLFSDLQKPLNLSRALDTINDHFGRDTIFPASMLRSRDQAPDRIAFGRLMY